MGPKTSPGLSYNQTVLKLLTRMTQSSGTIDQARLRHLIALGPSYLVLDTTMTENGMSEWSLGFNRLFDVVVALHRQDVLEIETLNEASRACSEAWSISTSWRGMDGGRTVVGAVALKLKENVLDSDGLSYKGQPIYVA